MKVFEINTVYNSGSTGHIVADLKHILEENGDTCYVAYGRGKHEEKNVFCISNKLDLYMHAFLTRITDRTGFFSRGATKKLIKIIQENQPDVIHIHNLHGYYLNIEMLFNFLKEYDKPVVLTLHDCWMFTGHCAYFDMSGCAKWKEGCYACQNLKQYPRALLDKSKKNYAQKKKLFTSLEKMTIVTPSKWLADQVKLSFLKNYPIEVINNGIDLQKFRPVSSNLRSKFNINNRFLIVGVASVWDDRKGLKYLVELAQRLGEQFAVVIIGLSKKQIKFYKNIESKGQLILLERTNSMNELAQWYSTADVFVNPTLEDNFPTTNIEALACGTPVITFDTGGSPEILGNPPVGRVVPKGDRDKLYSAVYELATNENKFSMDTCVKQAQKYEKRMRFEEYIKIYRSVIDEKELISGSKGDENGEITN